MQLDTRKKYTDVVFCVDATASMAPFLSALREMMPQFRDITLGAFDKMDADLGTLRVRFVFFRDAGYDRDWLVESEFFTLPEDTDHMMGFLGAMEAEGGGDKPESALEALVCAINSDWAKDTPFVRQIMLLFTDSNAHPLGTHTHVAGYPNGMPESLEELDGLWQTPNGLGYRPRRARLVTVAPGGVYPWNDIEWIGHYSLCEDPVKLGAEGLRTLVENLPGFAL